jgi:hypothetical protein
MRFVPFRYQGDINAIPAVCFPTLSVLSPDSTFVDSTTAALDSAFFSFNNCMLRGTYVENTRHIPNYTDLAICK